MLVPSIVLVLGLATPLQSKASVEIRGASFKAATLELSRAFGQKIRAEESMNRDILLLKIDSQTLKSTLDQISAAFDCEWKEQDGAFIVFRSPEGLRMTDREEKLRWREEVEELIELKSKELVSSFEANPVKLIEGVRKLELDFKPGQSIRFPTREEEVLRSQFPLRIAIVKAVKSLGLQRLSAVTPGGDPIVWSSNPSRAQIQLPSPASEALNRGFEQERFLRSTFSQTGVSESETKRIAYMFSSNNTKPLGNASRVLLKISASQSFRTLNADLIYFGVGSEVIVKESLQFSLPPASQGTRIIRATGVKKSLMDAVNRQVAKYDGIDPESWALLLRPTEFDPLRILAAPLLFNLPTPENPNLIANISDSVAVSIGGIEQISESQLVRRLANERLNFSANGGWVKIKPQYSSLVRASRANRQVLQAFAKQLATNDLEFEDYATYLAQLPGPLREIYQASIRKESVGFQSRMVGFYGSLTSQQRVKMKDGVLEARELLPDQLKNLAKLVSGDLYSRNSRSDLNLQLEPTDVLPDGIPPDTNLSMSVEKEEVVFVKPKREGNDRTSTSGYAPADLAFAVYENENSTGSVNQVPVNLDRLFVTQVSEYQFRFKLGPEISSGATFRFVPFKPRREVRFKDLSPVFQMDFNSTLASIRKNPPPSRKTTIPPN